MAEVKISEAEMTKTFCSLLESDESPWGRVRIIQEFDYRRGKTDVIAVDISGNVSAFELKVSRWMEAMHQAFRNGCYAHCTYVVLPEKTARRALKYRDDFARRTVGICALNGRSIKILLPAICNIPVLPWLTDKVNESAKNEVD